MSWLGSVSNQIKAAQAAKTIPGSATMSNGWNAGMGVAGQNFLGTNPAMFADLYNMYKDRAKGMSSQQMGAIRSEGIGNIQNQVATAIRNARAQSALNGVRGAAAQAAVNNIENTGTNNVTNFERSIGQKQFELQGQGLEGLDRFLSGERFGKLSTAAGFAGLANQAQQQDLQNALSNRYLDQAGNEYQQMYDAYKRNNGGMFGGLQNWVANPVQSVKSLIGLG